MRVRRTGRVLGSGLARFLGAGAPAPKRPQNDGPADNARKKPEAPSGEKPPPGQLRTVIHVEPGEQRNVRDPHRHEMQLPTPLRRLESHDEPRRSSATEVHSRTGQVNSDVGTAEGAHDPAMLPLAPPGPSTQSGRDRAASAPSCPPSCPGPRPPHPYFLMLIKPAAPSSTCIGND